MPRKRSKNEQLAFAQRQAENGARLDEVCQKMGVSEPTVYRWKKQFVGMGVQAPAQRCQRRGNRYNEAKGLPFAP